jgi:hypothetical protein
MVRGLVARLAGFGLPDLSAQLIDPSASRLGAGLRLICGCLRFLLRFPLGEQRILQCFSCRLRLRRWEFVGQASAQCSPSIAQFSVSLQAMPAVSAVLPANAAMIRNLRRAADCCRLSPRMRG